MQDFHHSSHADSNVAISIGTTVLSAISFWSASFTKSNIAWGLGCLSACVAIVSGVMAIRYYFHATKKLKNETKKGKK